MISLLPQSSRKNKAFSLGEILVTVAVLGILMAILFPAVSKTKQTAQQAKTISRMRNLGAAFVLYSQDNGGAMPMGTSSISRWWKQLFIYVNPPLGEKYQNALQQGGDDAQIAFEAAKSGAFMCASIEAAVMPKLTRQNHSLGIFLYNRHLDQGWAGIPTRLSQLSRPSKLPVLTTAADDTGAQVQLDFVPHPKAAAQGWTGGTSVNGPSPNFGNKAGFLFADWHVEMRDICDSSAWPWDQSDKQWHFRVNGGEQGQ